MSGTSVLLGSGYPWQTAGDDASTPPLQPAVVANAHDGLSLPALPDGPLGLMSADGSLGRLALPRGVAVEGDTVLVLSADGSLVYRYNALHQTLEPLAHVGAQGLCGPNDECVLLEPRRFRHANAIALLHGVLYVADPEAQRVQVFDLKTLALLRIHAGLQATDLAAGAQSVYMLDRARGRVHAATLTRDTLVVVVDLDTTRTSQAKPYLVGRAGGWDRIAVDRLGRVYLRHRCGGRAELDVFDLSHCTPVACISERVFDSGEVRDRFDPPLVTMDASGVLGLPDRLLDPCGLRTPLADGAPRWDIGGRLHVADPASHSLLVYLPDGRLRHRFGPFDVNGVACASVADDAWSPGDMAEVDETALVLDIRHQWVYAHRLGDSALQRWFAAPANSARSWRRIAVDASGCLLFWDGSATVADRFTQRGQPMGTVAMRSVRALFSRPPVTRQPSLDRAGVLLTRSGASPRPERSAPTWPAARFRTQGDWTSEWLDSEMHDCVWHAIELRLRKLPPGASVLVRTRTSNKKQTPAEFATSLDTLAGLGAWNDSPAFVGEPQPGPASPAAVESDLLVLSGPGRYLQLQIRLTGTGADTPVVERLRLRYPRESLLQYLPAIYSSPPEQQEFLDRFLSIVQTTWSHIEREVATFERHVDPDSVPDDEMAYLAGWLDLHLEGGWTPAQNRRLLQAMPAVRPKWGTVEGLRDWVRVYLANIGSVEPADLKLLGVPGIVERFVERRSLRLGGQGAALGTAEALWGPSIERRFQLGVFDRIGDVELVSTGDPELDAFSHYAHSFRVYVPAILIRTPEDEALVRRAIELQKPAHATYELVLVEPRFRIGVQSTIELDTVIGAPLSNASPLSCATDAMPPSRAPHGRLGYDTTLASRGTPLSQENLA
jgi:phage tail-like protein